MLSLSENICSLNTLHTAIVNVIKNKPTFNLKNVTRQKRENLKWEGFHLGFAARCCHKCLGYNYALGHIIGTSHMAWNAKFRPLHLSLTFWTVKPDQDRRGLQPIPTCCTLKKCRQVEHALRYCNFVECVSISSLYPGKIMKSKVILPIKLYGCRLTQ